MLSVMGGLAVMLGSSPLAAQTTASATRAISPSTVLPGGEVTVTIAVADNGGSGGVTETLPEGFAYVDGSATPLDDFQVLVTGQNVRFTLQGESSFTYTVTASSMEGPYTFEGSLRDSDRNDSSVGGATDVTVSADTGPASVDVGDLQFDVVPAKAVKGAVVSGLKHPIGTKPLEWDVTGNDVNGDATGLDSSATVVGTFDGAVGDFEVRSEGSGKFRLYVATSDAPNLSGTRPINVEVTLDPDDTVEDDNVVVNLTGEITPQIALELEADGFAFTIPQSITAGTPIGAFGVNGGIRDEYLDGIVSGDDAAPFEVRDTDMTLVYKGGSLEVKTYEFKLTVSGDAGLANRTDIGTVAVTVTASNLAPTAPAIFAATVEENDDGDAGLVSADTAVHDASAGVDSNDGDTLTYTLRGTDVFAIDPATGMITVGDADISASTGGPDDDPETDDADAKYIRGDDGELVDDTDEFSDITYTFQVMVSDGISANNQYITATVTVDANEPTELVDAADLPANVVAGMIDHDGDGDGDEATDMVAGYKVKVSVTAGDVPMTLFNLGNLVSDADGDNLSFDVSGNPSHVIHDKSSDNLDLTYLPPGSEDGRVNTITVGVSDGFNGADDDDQTLYIEISVTEEQPDPITSSFVSITVDENSTDCSQDDVASGCSVAGVVSDAISFSIESGVDGGDTDYAVADDGTITVLNAPNYEDGQDPAFLVNANGADGLAGLISVRVSVTDVNEETRRLPR